MRDPKAAFGLELEPHERAKLYDAFAITRSEFTKCPARAVHICAVSVWVVEMRLIEKVFGFPSNLEAEAFGEFENSSQAGIKLPKPWPSEPGLGPIDIADAGCRTCHLSAVNSIWNERVGVEPLGEPASIICASEVVNWTDMVRYLGRVEGGERIAILAELQRRAGEGGEHSVEFPPAHDVVHDVVAARPFLAGSERQIIDVRQLKIMRMVEAQRAVIERQAPFRHSGRGWAIELQPVLPGVVVDVAHRSRIGVGSLNEEPMTRAMVYGNLEGIVV